MEESLVRGPQLVNEDYVRNLIGGATVAIVGNSADLLDRSHGHLIDVHDVVLRMNTARYVDAPITGTRTTIQTVGQARLIKEWDPDPLYWWMKITPHGTRELTAILKTDYPLEIWDWPADLENRCRNYINADPSTGMRCAWVCRQILEAKEVRLFGMSCWGRLYPGSDHSTWKPRSCTPNHSPEREAAAIRRLGYTEEEEGVWAWSR